MRTRSGSRLTAALVVSVQLTVAIVGTVGMCLERPHTHAGVPAPDCPMHHGDQAAAAVATTPQHHHHSSDAAPSSSPGSTGISCRCAGDSLSLLLATAAVVVHSPLVTPVVARSDAPALIERVADLHEAPLSPPPRLLA